MTVSTTLLLIAINVMPSVRLAESEPTEQFSLRPEVYERLTKAQESLHQAKYDEAIEEITRIQKRIRLTDHEKALTLQTLGYVYAGQGKLTKAASTLEDCHGLQALPAATQLSLLFNIGQIHLGAKNYQRSVVAFDAWVSMTDRPNASALYTIAAAHYQNKNYTRCAYYAERAIASTSRPEDSWLQLLLSAYVETKRYRPAVGVLETMVERHPDKKNNWLQLSAMYAQLGDDQRALAVLALAYEHGVLDRPEEKVQLAQRYLAAQIPYAAGELLEREASKKKIEMDRDNTRLLATAWLRARDTRKAVDAMERAAKLSEDGELYVRLSQLHLDEERYESAIQAGQKALAKGGVKNVGQVRLLIGIANFRLGRLGQARKAFTDAKKHPSSSGSARGWLKYLTANAPKGATSLSD